MTEVQVYDTQETRSALNEKILANARLSAVELGELVGLAPEVAAEKRSRLLEDRGSLTERQEERLLLIELGDLLTDARKRLTDAEIGDYASIYRAIISNMTLMANRFDARKKVVEADLDKLTRANARLFGEVYDVATDKMMQLLTKQYPELAELITDNDKQAARREALMYAAKKLESKVVS